MSAYMEKLLAQLGSERQRDVCRLTLKEPSVASIARRLGLTQYQVKDARKGIYKRFGVHSVKELQAVFGIKHQPDQKPHKETRRPKPMTGNPFELTDKQFETCKLAQQGLSLAQIAETLGIHKVTVHDRLQRACIITGTKNTKELCQVLFEEKKTEPAVDYEEANKHLLDVVIPELKQKLASVTEHDRKKQQYISKLETDLRSARSQISKHELALAEAERDWEQEHKKRMDLEKRVAVESIVQHPTHCSLCQEALEQL